MGGLSRSFSACVGTNGHLSENGQIFNTDKQAPMSNISGKAWTISIPKLHQSWLRTFLNPLLKSFFVFLQLLQCRGKPGKGDGNRLGLCQYLKQVGKMKTITRVLVSES